ncbi:MAG: hypothetical protein HYX51_01540 [Chloroflexi bacterium]|nr:hypothetical protein [Chloroflexota bacterium]
MNLERIDINDPRIQAAVAELTGLIRDHYPAAGFTVGEGEDPPGVYVTATVDVDDTDEVVDLFIDRMVDIQVKDGLPVFVIPVRPIERVVAAYEQERRTRPTASLPHVAN